MVHADAIPSVEPHYRPRMAAIHTLPPNVERLPSGSLRIAVRAGGRKHHVTVPGDSSRAEIEMARATLRLKVGAATATDRSTLRTMIAEIHADWTKAPNTLVDRERVVRLFIPDDLLDRSVDQITTRQIDTLYRSLVARGVGVDRIGRVADVIGTALDRAARLGLVTHNAARNVPRPSIERREIEPPAGDDLEDILTGIPFGWLAVGATILPDTGIRRGELAALRWDALSIDGERSVMSIQRAAIVRRGGVVEVVDTKTGRRGRRQLGLDPSTVAVLRAWRTHSIEDALAHGRPLSPWVFPGRNPDVPRRPDAWTQAWRKHLKKHGLPHVRLHDLRHFHATALLNGGLALPLASKRLGHSGTQITGDLYVHLLPAADELAARIGAAASRRKRSAAGG